jgi:molybdenum cofactor cytidylyltransferase
VIVDAAILAAGSSRRLGRPKQAIEIGGRPLLTRAAEAAIEAGCRQVLVILGDRARSLSALVPPGARRVVNPRYAEGMGSTIRVALDEIGREEVPPDGLLLAVCDQPALDARILREVLETWDRTGRPYAAACTYGDTIGTPAVFAPEAFPELAAMSGDRGARGLLRRSADRVVRVSWPAGARDVDLPSDLP